MYNSTKQQLNLYVRAMFAKQGIALTGRNRSGPPWSVGRPTAGSVTDVRHRQTTMTLLVCPPLHYV